MKKTFLGLLFLLPIFLVNCSQATRGVETKSGDPVRSGANAFDPKDLSLTLELADNPNRDQQPQTQLTFTNNGRETLPASGWKLFFNSTGRPKAADTTVARISHFNGDLHFLAPGSAFGALQPGESKKIAMAGGRIRNYTDFPAGYYLVWDAAPEKGFPVKVQVNPGTHFDKATLALAEKIFRENEKIKDIPAEKLVKILPTPVSYKETGQPFVLTSEVVIVTDQEFGREAGLLADALGAYLGRKPAIQPQGSGKAIFLRKAQGHPAEGYALSVNPDRIQVSATYPAGMFYGLQSLRLLLPPSPEAGSAGTLPIAGVEVKDAPRFGYRGFMMDVARNFQPKAEVLKVLEAMAVYKMNVFHFHFSEDEGWRLEIPSLPELTTVGATRAHTLDDKTSLVPSYGSGPDAENPAGTGFYSKEDFVEILKYARDRHIQVIPEIESPGHARAAIKAMDARYDRLMQEGKKEEAERYLLRDLQDKSVYRSVQSWNDNIMDVSQESTYNFLERVVDDLIAMYKEAGAPLKTIHFGGDEVPSGVWEKSPAVQALIAKEPSVRNTDDLWYYYFSRVNQMLKERNLFLSGWEEIGLKKVVRNGKVDWVPNPAFASEHFQVNVWKNSPGSGAEDLAYRMANAGYKVILTGVTHLYLDLAYNPSYDEPGQYWGGYVDVEKPFYFIPYDYLRNLREDDRGNPINRSIIKSKEPLTEKGKANIVGIEAPLWSETNRTPEQFEYKLFPKLLGVAERAWAKDPQWAIEKNPAKSEALYTQAWSEFVNTVGKRELPRLNHLAGGFQYRIPSPGVVVRNGKVEANVQFPGLTIRYTTDGTEPMPRSPAYSGPIAATGPVKLKVFNAAGRGGQTITIQNGK